VKAAAPGGVILCGVPPSFPGGSIHQGVGRRLDAWLRQQHEASLLATGLALAAGFGHLDSRVAPDLAPLAYLVPVLLVAYYASARAAVLVALAAGAAWLLGAGAASPFWDVMIRLAALLVAAAAVSALRASLDREHLLARTDPLTGLANVRSFYELAEGEIARARRYTHPFTAVYIDLDAFKGINDRAGHSAGDGVLCAVARGIQSSVRATDLVARVGGDEFVLLLPETSAAPARLVVHKVQELLSRTRLVGDAPLGACMGVATYFTPPATVDALIQTADALMYQAKAHGPGAVEHRTFN